MTRSSGSRRSSPTRTPPSRTIPASRSPSIRTTATTTSRSTSASGHSTRTRPCAKRSRCASTTTKTVEVATGGNGVPGLRQHPAVLVGLQPRCHKYKLDVAAAKAKIEGAGWTLGSDDIYAKDGKKLSIDPLRSRRPAAAPRVRPAGPRPAQGLRYRHQCPGRRPQHGPDPEGPRLPERLRHVPRWVVDGSRSGRLLDLPQLRDPDEGDAFGEQLPGLEERRSRQAP